MRWSSVVCLLVAGACRFEADYTGSRVLCNDEPHKCPSDLECRPLGADMVCLETRQDAAIDMPTDTMTDGNDMMPPALNCAQPGMLLATGGVASDSTASRTSKVAPLCNGTVMNGPDAVYSINPGAGKQMTISIATSTGGYQVVAYVTAPCAASSCSGNTYATPGNPIVLTTVAGPQFIIVDSGLAASSGQYTLTVSIN